MLRSSRGRLAVGIGTQPRHRVMSGGDADVLAPGHRVPPRAVAVSIVDPNRRANKQEEQASRERQQISQRIQELVLLAREIDPGLTEEEALVVVSAELRRLRGRTSQLETELAGLRRYRQVAKYNQHGVTERAGMGIRETSPIARDLVALKFSNCRRSSMAIAPAG